MSVLGGTELIYLADNGCNHLAKYLELFAIENTPYQVLKDKIQTFIDTEDTINGINTYLSWQFDVKVTK